MTDLQVEIISPTGIVLQDVCYMAVVPALDGDIGVMANHEAFIARLKEGHIKIYKSTKQEKSQDYEVKSGFAEIDDQGKLLILIDWLGFIHIKCQY